MTTPDLAAIVRKADRKEVRAMRKWNGPAICPRGIKRVCRLRREAQALRKRAHLSEKTDV